MYGAAASSGVAVGPAFVFRRGTAGPIPEVENPQATFQTACAEANQALLALKAQAQASNRMEAADVLGAQAAMAEDVMMIDEVNTLLGQGVGLEEATSQVSAQLSAMLASLDDEYLAARSNDVVEVMSRIRMTLSGGTEQTLVLVEPSIIITEELTAADTATLDPAMVLGFITERGGPTGHVAVIARSLAIPAVVGVADVAGENPTSVALNGSTGEVCLDPTADDRAQYAELIDRETRKRSDELKYAGVAVAFNDRSIRVAANVGTPAELDIAASADGIGLYRTEFLFLDRSAPPTEDEQFAVYKSAVEHFAHPVVMRTFDIGGDKPATYLDMEPEENPFLGVRGVRLYASEAELFASQARALLRAAVFGDLWVMIPMITTVAEIVAVRSTIEVHRQALEAEAIPFGSLKLGVMIEVPAAAINARQLAKHVDFFSIGTNDLTQYTMATDRTSGVLAAYSDAAHPAVLELCRLTAEAATEADISVAVCGEAAANPVTAAMFLAMGMDKLSVAPSSVNTIRALVDQLDVPAAKQALAASLAADSADEVRSIVEAILP